MKRKSENLSPLLTGGDDEERKIEHSLRPQTFNEFTGQSKITDNLKVFIGAAKIRREG
ncbi:MAG: Holliday junction branch migration DNA helicase RuvB, partial [Bacteroidota bacterium]